MTDDGASRKPPRAVTVDISGDDDEVYVPPTPTERQPLLPPRRQTPAEPFKKLTGREPSYVEFSAHVKQTDEKITGMVAAVAQTLATQRKMALQMDGFQSTINQRFDIFHEELSMLRQTVSGDHAPRITAVEKSTTEKVKRGALVGGRYAMYFTTAAVVARLAGKAYPEFSEAIESVLGVFGL